MGNKNKKNIDDIIFIGAMCFLLFSIILIFSFAIYGSCYKLPQAAENANLICQEQGYDFYESFERIGILSSTPVAIQCKYVENYKEIDLTQHYSGSSD